VANVIYLAANLGLAFSESYAALFLLRCLQSTGSSGAVALALGVVADISTSAERGSYMGIVGSAYTPRNRSLPRSTDFWS